MNAALSSSSPTKRPPPPPAGSKPIKSSAPTCPKTKQPMVAAAALLEQAQQPAAAAAAIRRRRRRFLGHSPQRSSCRRLCIMVPSTSTSSTLRLLWFGALILATRSLSREAAVFLVKEEEQQQRHQQGAPSSLSSERSTGGSTIMLTESPSRNSNNNDNSHHPTNLMFAHVGKAGGETIKRLLKPTCYLHYHSRRGVRACLDKLLIVHKRNNNNLTIAPTIHDNMKNSTGNMESRITQVVKSYMHVDTLRYPSRENASSEADGYLFNLRHPLERLISWYDQGHPVHCNRLQDNKSAMCATDRRVKRQPHEWDAQFYGHCFPTLDALALALQGISVVPQQQQQQPTMQTRQELQETYNRTIAYGSPSNCTSLAWSNIMGMGGIPSNHLFFNLRYYATATTFAFPEKKIYVIRTENLWDDLAKLEQLFSSSSSNHDDDDKDHHRSPGPALANRSNIDTNSSNLQTLFAALRGSKVSHGSESYNKTAISSPRYTKNLCCGLMDELLLYRHLLQKAVNLNRLAKEETWGRAVEICSSSTSKKYRNDDIDAKNSDYKLLWKNLVQECISLRSAARVCTGSSTITMKSS